jgi:hypothetical protein
VTQPNPFAAPQQVAPEQQPNPFAQAPAAPQQQAAPNPFASNVPAATGVVAPNPFGQQPAVPAAPQAYAPQQQYAAPAPATPPVQAYAPPAAAPMALDPNALRAAGAPPASYSKGPELPDMYGRLVLIFPQDIARVPRNPRFITDQDRARGNVEQDRMTATIVVLDSGPGTAPGSGTIAWGGAPYALPPTPHTNNDPLPYVIKGKWISQSKLIDQCRAYVPAPGGAPGMIAGRLVKRGPAHNDPWYLETATDGELAIAAQYLQLVNEQRYPHPLAPA